MEDSKEVQERYWRKDGFVEGVAAERTRLISYLVEKAIIRRDALGFWVRDTMGDEVTELDDLDTQILPKRADGKLYIHPSEIGAMMVRNNAQHDEALKKRLLLLRELAPAGSEVSLAITRWVNEIV